MPLEKSLLEKIPLSAEALPLILPLPSPLPPLATPPRRVTLRKLHLKSEFVLPNFIALIPSRLIRQMLAIFLELNSKGQHQTSGKEKRKFLSLVPVLGKT